MWRNEYDFSIKFFISKETYLVLGNKYHVFIGEMNIRWRYKEVKWIISRVNLILIACFCWPFAYFYFLSSYRCLAYCNLIFVHLRYSKYDTAYCRQTLNFGEILELGKWTARSFHRPFWLEAAKLVAHLKRPCLDWFHQHTYKHHSWSYN